MLRAALMLSRGDFKIEDVGRAPYTTPFVVPLPMPVVKVAVTKKSGTGADGRRRRGREDAAPGLGPMPAAKVLLHESRGKGSRIPSRAAEAEDLGL